MFKQSSLRFAAASLVATFAMSSVASATDTETDPPRQYEVKVTNITRGAQFTPILTAVHNDRVSLFTLGAPASSGLKTLAEEGNTAPLSDTLSTNPNVLSVATQGGLLGPGQTRVFTVESSAKFDSLTVAAMLIPTNDAFFSVTVEDLPRGRDTVSRRGVAYDSGTEQNDELCSSIPGPFFTECNGPGGGGKPGNGEGFVHVNGGIHGVGDLKASLRDWRNPVVSVTVRRVR